MKKFTISLFALFFFLALSWYFFQRVDNGYIAKISDSEDGNSLWVIELDAKQTEGKTKEQVKRLLEEEAARAAGTYYKIPWMNRWLGTEFEEGDKVQVFWRGAVMESAPGQIDGTNLILNFEY